MSQLQANPFYPTIQLPDGCRIKAIRKSGSKGGVYLAYDGVGWFRLIGGVEIDLAEALFSLASQFKGLPKDGQVS